MKVLVAHWCQTVALQTPLSMGFPRQELMPTFPIDSGTPRPVSPVSLSIIPNV